MLTTPNIKRRLVESLWISSQETSDDGVYQNNLYQILDEVLSQWRIYKEILKLQGCETEKVWKLE